MAARSNTVIAGSAIALLVVFSVVWFAVIRDQHKPPVEQPKTMADLLVGKWKQVDQPADRDPSEPGLFGFVCYFSADGRYEGRVIDFFDGPEEVSGTYQLEGNILRLFTPASNNLSPTRNEIWEFTSTIETLTEEELITVTLIKKRWTPERAQQLAQVRGVPVEQVLAEVREDRFRSAYVRVRDEPLIPGA